MRPGFIARTGGLPFEASLETEFTVGATAGGALLRVRQSGFPDSPTGDDFHAGCVSGWEATFAGIERFASARG